MGGRPEVCARNVEDVAGKSSRAMEFPRVPVPVFGTKSVSSEVFWGSGTKHETSGTIWEY